MLKFRTDFGHVTVDVVQMFKVNGVKSEDHSVRLHNILASKIVTLHEQINGLSLSLNSVKIIPAHSITRETCSRS